MTGIERCRLALAAGLLLLLVGLSACGPDEPRLAGQDDPRAAGVAARLTEAERAAGRLEGFQERALLLSRVARSLAPIDPGRAASVLAQAEELAARCDSDEWRERALWLKAEGRGWEREPRERALALSERLMDGAGRGWGLRAVAEGWLSLDRDRARSVAERALRVALKNPDQRSRELDLRGLVALLARLDRQRAASVAGLIEDPELLAWAGRDLAVAAARAGELETAHHLFGRALGATGLIRDPSRRALSLARLGEGWAGAGGAAGAGRALALAWRVAEGVRPAWRRACVQAQVAAAWAAADRRRAGWLAEGIDQAYPEARFYALKEIARRTPEPAERQRRLLDALQEALKTGSAFETDQAVSLVAAELAPLDPWRALQVARRIRPTNELARGQALAAILPVLAGRDPEAALAEARGLHNPHFRARCLAGIAATMLKRDGQGARRVLGEAVAVTRLGAGPRALAELALVLAEVDPKGALEVAAAAQPASERALVLARLAGRLGQGGERVRLAYAGVALDQALRAAGATAQGRSLERAEALLGVGQRAAQGCPAEAAEVLQAAAQAALGVK